MALETLYPELISSGVTLIVGLFAFIVYRLQKTGDVANAASIIIMDIRRAEQNIDKIKRNGSIDKNIPTVLIDNNWVKYRHTLQAEISYDEANTLNNFFDSCAEIDRARQWMLDLFQAGLQAKAATLQSLVAECHKNRMPDEERKRVFSAIEKDPYTFFAADPQEIILKQISIAGTPSASPVFSKLKKIGRIKT